jgi:hypothetical protein
VENATAMIWKLLTVAEQSWRKLNAPELLQGVYDGIKYKDGVRVEEKKPLPESSRAGSPDRVIQTLLSDDS